ncbi:MAG: hypothetical protein KDB08_01040 [Microthrixaceae bacterium]|nr:hypothetical protein [Microthrixaceae bacterium]
MTENALTALAINCTRKHSPAASSCEVLGRQIIEFLGARGVECASVRAVDA